MADDGMAPDVRYEIDGQVGLVTLDRPQVHNALRRRTYDELTELVRTTSARVLVITGAGTSFCSGDDVRELMNGGEGAAPRPAPRLTPAAGVLLLTDVPVIAAVNGPAVGWGMELALMADLRTTLGELFATEDHREGVRLFLEKRPPPVGGQVGPHPSRTSATRRHRPHSPEELTMEIADATTLLTGGASGLGQATARRLVDGGGRVVIADLPTSSGAELAKELGAAATFVAADVTEPQQIEAALDAVAEVGELRAVVHTAGSGRAQRIVDREGNPANVEWFRQIVELNLIGSFNVLRLAAARMTRLEPLGEERGVVVMTASIAAFDGQIGQASYSASKAGVVGMTLVAARDLAGRGIRVCTIAPGLFDTPLLSRMEEEKKAALGAQVPHPHRLGQPDEYGRLAVQIIENPMLNGETIRLDGALRMAPR